MRTIRLAMPLVAFLVLPGCVTSTNLAADDSASDALADASTSETASEPQVAPAAASETTVSSSSSEEPTTTVSTGWVIQLTDPYAPYRQPTPAPDLDTPPGSGINAPNSSPEQPPSAPPVDPDDEPDPPTPPGGLDIPDDFGRDWQPVGLTPCDGFEPNETYDPPTPLLGAYLGTRLAREDDVIVSVDVDGLDPNEASPNHALDVFAKAMQVSFDAFGVPNRMWVPGPFNATNFLAPIHDPNETFVISKARDDRFWYASAHGAVKVLDAEYEPTYAWQIARVSYSLYFLDGRPFAQAEGIHCALYIVNKDGNVEYRSRTMYPSVVLPVPGGGEIHLDDMIRARATLKK